MTDNGPGKRSAAGIACRLSGAEAACSALQEAIQARLTHISGARDDLFNERYEADQDVRGNRWGGGSAIQWQHSLVLPDDVSKVPVWRRLADHLFSCGVNNLYLFRLETSYPDIVVVRVLGSGMATATASQTALSRAALASFLGTGILSTIVFAGPSIHQTELAAYANITFCPPAASGDILAAINVGARTIGLIDGVFGDCAAVWHKELLFALSKGVAVYGAASMGALRAAECDCFGMKGVGQIYEQYRDGSRISDADVAVLHGPPDMDFRPVTIALVDAEETIRALQSRIGDEQAHSLLNAARRTHFSRRTWRSIVTAAQLGQELTSLLSHNAISVKRLDAQMLLDAVNNHRHDAGARPAWRFQNTLFFQEMIARNAEQAARFAAPPIR